MPSESRSAERKRGPRGIAVRLGTGLALTLMLTLALANGAGSAGPVRLVRPGATVELRRAPIGAQPLIGLPVVRALRAGSTPKRREAADDRLVAYHVEFADAASCNRYAPPGGTVFHRFQRFAGVFVASDRIDDLVRATVRAPGFRAIEDDDITQLPPRPRPRTAPPSKAVPENIVRGGLAGLTGRGTLVGIVDTGVDFRHSDFVTEGSDGPRSRIVAYWDTGLPFDPSRGSGRPGPIAYPNGQPVGTVFTGAELTHALRNGGLDELVDHVGHGTACAGIAAGNGRGLESTREVLGVAPGAALLVVRAQTSDELPGLSNFVITPAVHWMSTIADSLRRPLVVSCSFGQQIGLHDGSRLVERELEALLPDGAPGRALVVSAGNDGTRPVHARMTLGAKPQVLEWHCGDGDALLELHLRTRDSSAVQAAVAVRSDNRPSDIATYPLAPVVKGSAWQIVRFRVAGDIGGIYLWSKTPGVPVEAYISGGEFAARFTVPTGTVASPGTCRAAITVGSYDWNDMFDQKGLGPTTLFNACSETPIEIGELSCYSSRGFVHRGLVKPDLVAPGQWFTAPVSLLAPDRPAGLGMASAGVYEGLHGSGHYRWFNGTSAAAPYVAGVLALALERDPRLTLGSLRNRLRASLSRDATTGAVPNTAWGYGRLDLAAVKRFLAVGVRATPRGR